MTSPTRAQRDVLEQMRGGQALFEGPRIRGGRMAWLAADVGRNIARPTFDALRRAGWVVIVGRSGPFDTYGLTEAGRAVLGAEAA